MQAEFMKDYPETEASERAVANAAEFLSIMMGAGYSEADTAWACLHGFIHLARRGDRELWIGQLTAVVAFLNKDGAKN